MASHRNGDYRKAREAQYPWTHAAVQESAQPVAARQADHDFVGVILFRGVEDLVAHPADPGPTDNPVGTDPKPPKLIDGMADDLSELAGWYDVPRDAASLTSLADREDDDLRVQSLRELRGRRNQDA